MNPFNHRIPFEIHLTARNISIESTAEFIRLCAELGGKPLLIELERGSYPRQLMFTGTVFENGLTAVLARAGELAQEFDRRGFSLQRTKIETNAENADLFERSGGEYFEWHGQINPFRIENISALCEKHGVHLSRNSLRGEPELRFLTLREYDSREVYRQRLAALIEDLGAGQILKAQSEFCLYDSNTDLDGGWLGS